MDDIDPRFEVSLCPEDGFYDLRAGKDHFASPGLVLIFNQLEFEQNEETPVQSRSETPGIDLKKTLEELGFEVIYCRNFRRVQIMNIIGKYANLKNYEKNNYASFMLFFLSHGNIKIFENDYYEIVKTADDDMLISDIWKNFENTKTWNNKPKCFFFQTCRGHDLVEGVKILNREPSRVNEETYDGPPDPSFSYKGPLPKDLREKMNIAASVYDTGARPNEHRHNRNYLGRREIIGCHANSSIPFTEPKFSDLLIVHSTYQGATTFREPEHSPFINAIITNFRKNLFEKDLLSIVQDVQKEIAYAFHASESAERDVAEFVSAGVEGSRLMPVLQSTLTGKICYQNPKNIQVANMFCSQKLPFDYDMQKGKGKAVIFANKYRNMEFPSMPFVTADVNGLETSLLGLKCDISLHWDLQKGDFIRTLNEVGSGDFSEYDFFFLVFYGYGRKDYLIVRDQQNEFLEDYVEVAELWQPFLGSRCSTLKDKPKFFIISANGVQNPGISGKFRRFVKKDVNIEQTRALNHEASCDPGEIPSIYVIPEASDFLVLFHSAAGTAKYMNFIDDEDQSEEEMKSQSIFFEKLNEQLQNERNFVGDRHLFDVIVKFQYKITQKIAENVRYTRESQNKREVPLVFSTLTKNFVLNVTRN
ncbi:uncharacterized protein LOC134838072 [Culicoides brevitarsis]|uniref:uncharacterized protein LOC134838072 n=1 Tax=Culicoides brevitarsis TaxID=469753 RepID=UPI00307BE014